MPDFLPRQRWPSSRSAARCFAVSPYDSALPPHYWSRSVSGAGHDKSSDPQAWALIEGPSAWIGADMRGREAEWAYCLSPPEIAEIEAAVKAGVRPSCSGST
jgi:hypothetical protein